VLQRDRVVGVDLRTGAVRWERPDVGGTWRAIAGQFVLEGPVAVVRVDPESGATTGEVPRAGAVAVAAGAVTLRDAELVAVDWDGAVTWTLPLADGVAHRPVAVDAGRVAVRSSGAAGTTVTVVDAAAGTVLASAAVLPVGLPPPGADDDVVGLQLRGRAVPLVLDVGTGQVVDGPPPAMRRDRVQTPAGVFVLDAGVASVRVTGPQGAWRALLDAPVATTPIPLTGSVTVTTTDGAVHRLDPARGGILWQVQLDVLPTALAATADDVHVGTADGRVVVLDDRGRTTRSIDVGAAVVALAAGGEVVVVVTADGVVRGYPR
jgi:outer membrane protein assembly factor BamB